MKKAWRNLEKSNARRCIQTQIGNLAVNHCLGRRRRRSSRLVNEVRGCELRVAEVRRLRELDGALHVGCCWRVDPRWSDRLRNEKAEVWLVQSVTSYRRQHKWAKLHYSWCSEFLIRLLYIFVTFCNIQNVWLPIWIFGEDSRHLPSRGRTKRSPSDFIWERTQVSVANSIVLQINRSSDQVCRALRKK